MAQEFKNKYMICEAPICVGSPTKGSEDAFSELKSASVFSSIGAPVSFCPFTASRTVPCTENTFNLHGLETVMHVNKIHYGNLLNAFDGGYIPITIGGDHSIAMASIAALAANVSPENVAVIYIDGHTDINTEKSSETGYIHGMPLAAAMGLCNECLTVGDNKVSLYGKNTYIIGARSIDDGEYPIVEQQGVHLYTVEDVKKRGVSSILAEVLDATRGMNIHVSFDVDSIDGAEFPSTGYVMPDGLSYSCVYDILARILGGTDISSFDCVEYNPHLDNERKDLEKLRNIFKLFT